MQQKTSQLGTIGELLVMVKLTQKGWTALNANASVKNIARYDILCTKDEKNVAFIQVKTTKETTFPVGFSIGKAKDKSFLNEHIIGPWVFVRQIGDGTDASYRYYILTKEQVIKLIEESNNWYLGLEREGKSPSESSACALKESWLQGRNDSPVRLNGKDFINPLNNVKTEDAWDNIWSK